MGVLSTLGCLSYSFLHSSLNKGKFRLAHPRGQQSTSPHSVVFHALEGICPPVSRSPLDLPPPEVQVTPLETGDPSHTACDIAPLVSAAGLYMLLLHPSEGLPNDTLDVLRLSGAQTNS